MNEEKRNKIKNTLLETKLKRQAQKCISIELKVDESHLSNKSKEILKMFFLEAKWIYNYILSINVTFCFDYKTKIVKVLDKNKNLIEKEIKFLPAKMRQVIVKNLQQNIFSLSKSKKNGNKVGKLKFKSSYNSIDLNQYGTTHQIVSKNKIRINGIKQKIRVSGLEQIKDTYEFANAKLIKKPSGYYIKLICYEYIKPNQIIKKGKDIGLDFGIKDNITTSECEKINVNIEESERLKFLQKKFSRQVKGSNNRYKTLQKINKEYEKLNNRKKDASNKIVNYLIMNYDNVFIQDENLKGWKNSKRKGFGKRIQHSCMGTIKAKLINQKNVTIIDRYFPTTKMCYLCGSMTNMELKDRTYVCDCGLVEDRDIKAAKTILHVGRCKINASVPAERRDDKPVEKLSADVLSKDNPSHISAKQEATILQCVVVHERISE